MFMTPTPKRAWGKRLVLLVLSATPFFLLGDVALVNPLARLPPSSTSAEIADVLIRDGIVVLDQWTTREKVAAALQELETGRMSEGRNVRFGGSTQLLKWPLDPEKEAALLGLAADTVLQEAIELARRVHGQGSHHAIAWEVRLLILAPGTPEGDMHRDVVDTSKVPLQRPLQWGLNTIWAVDDFTIDNGATRFVPGSHSGSMPQGHWSGEQPEAQQAAAATMSAGSVVIYYASTLHGSGENRSPKTRTGLNFNYAFVDEAGGRPFDWGY
ncbi:cdmA [Symbiodinium natans]|uniref:CdmA protein n=1 Tax=Symbiodinium natans TaxID=878477 RepID=A0A812UXA6_9DINO|nr:cdmA [Symbiodinium natans]